MRKLISHKVRGLNEDLQIVVCDEPGLGNACHEYAITAAGGVKCEIKFQGGQFACRENAIALTKLQEAMLWLQKRTRDRMARGVEGTHKP